MKNQIQPRKLNTIRTIESFEQFLINIYSRKYDGIFRSKEAYASSLKKIIKCLGVTDNYFLNADMMQLIKWKYQISDKPAFSTLPAKHKTNLLSSYEAFLNYGRFQSGLINY